MTAPKFKEGDIVDIPKHKVKRATVEGIEEYMPGLFAYHLVGHSLPYREALLRPHERK